MKKLSVRVGGAISVAPLAMVVDQTSKRHQKEVIDSAMKMKEAPPSCPSRVCVPSSNDGDVLKEGVVLSMALSPSAPPTLPDGVTTHLFERGSKYFAVLFDVSLLACKAGVDSTTTKKKRKDLAVGRYDLRSRALK